MIIDNDGSTQSRPPVCVTELTMEGEAVPSRKGKRSGFFVGFVVPFLNPEPRPVHRSRIREGGTLTPKLISEDLSYDR